MFTGKACINNHPFGLTPAQTQEARWACLLTLNAKPNVWFITADEAKPCCFWYMMHDAPWCSKVMAVCPFGLPYNFLALVLPAHPLRIHAT
jgi:hypothetical protein